MSQHQLGPEMTRLIRYLSRMPGLGPRSARRAVLHLLANRDELMQPLAQAMDEAARKIQNCDKCGNLDTCNPCSICKDAKRDPKLLCVVEQVSDLWALERAGILNSRYHVLGGCLSPLDGIGPDDLNIGSLRDRVRNGAIKEVVLALNATVEGQSTLHYLKEVLEKYDIRMTQLAHGVPVGGELDYLDEGTLAAALSQRKSMQ